MFFVEVIAPIAIEFVEPVELEVAGFVVLQRGIGVELGGAFWFGGLALLDFQYGVLLQFRLDALLQRHDRQLEDFHRLDHARREPHAEVLLRPHTHSKI